MNKLKFFKLSELFTLQDVKSMYKKLVYQYHPDRAGGDLESMKIINIEYELVFAYVQDHPRSKEDSAENEKHDLNDGFREILEKIIHLNITIEICGSWLWITGNTYPVKNILSQSGLKWRSKKKAWSWSPEGYVFKHHKEFSLEKIRDTFGSIKVNNRPAPAPALC